MMCIIKLIYSRGCYKRGVLYSINVYIACYIQLLYNTCARQHTVCDNTVTIQASEALAQYLCPSLCPWHDSLPLSRRLSVLR